MRLPHDGRRRGFTLIELLVVIAIIAVLMSLTTAAVMKMFVKGPETQARVEIGQLGETALASARTEFDLQYVPSSLVLREDGAYNLSNAQHKRTVTLLKKMFGKNFNYTASIDWNGSGSIQPGDITLQGQHCLVFFTGGIPSLPSSGANACTGFSTNPQNPAQPGGTRRGPWFEFKADRLQRDTNGFFVYLDPFKARPYAYFSATAAGGNYTADCPALSVVPYRDGPGAAARFINPNGYQIISAGRDKAFGPGGAWNPTQGYTGGAGADDMANFSSRVLGAPQQ